MTDSGTGGVLRWGTLADDLNGQGGYSADAKASGLSATVLFTGVELNLTAPDGPLGGVKLASVRMPVETDWNEEFLGYVFHLRGHVSKSAGARVLIVADVAGTVRTFEFGYGDSQTGATPAEGAQPHYDAPFFAEGFALERRYPPETNQPRPPLPDMVVSILLSVTRRSPEDAALVVLDGADIGAAFASSRAAQHKQP